MTEETQVEKFPELRAMMEKLNKEREEILARSEPLRRQRDILTQQIAPVLNEIKRLEREFIAIERPRLAEIDNQRGALAKAMGGRSLSQPGAETPAE